MKNYILIFFLIYTISVNSQGYWINTIGGVSYDNTTSMVIDNQGNLIIVGEITNTAYFNNDSITGSDAHSASRYIAKYSTDNGTLIWVKKIADSIQYIRCVEIDSEDNILITGTIGDDYNTDYFVAKYNTNGIFQWKRTGMGNGINQGYSIETINNDIYVIGYFHNTAIFNDTTISSSQIGSLFFAKYNSSGDIIFIRQPFHWSRHPVDLVKDSSNNLYFLCQVYGSQGQIGITVTKFDISNVLLWEKYYYGIEDEIYSNYIEASSLAIYDSNNIIICGHFWGEIYSNSDTITSYGENDYFVSCFDSIGELKWINHDMSSEFGNGLNSITISQNFDIYSIGDFKDHLIFYNDSSVNANGFGNIDILIAKYDSAGQLISVNIGGNDGVFHDYGMNIISKDSSIFFSGMFGGTGFFGDAIVQSNGQKDVVFGKYNELVSWGLPTSVNNYMNNSESIVVYPIPVRDNLHITNIPIDNKERIIRVINVNGQLIRKQLKTINKSNIIIDMNEVQNGLYLVQIIDTNKIHNYKVIKN